VNCHEIESTVVFYVAAFGSLGSSSDQCAEQHVAIRFDLGPNDPEQPSWRKLADFYAWNGSAQHGAADSKHNATDSGYFSGNSGCIGANYSGNCS
jgi:hypothetical protein